MSGPNQRCDRLREKMSQVPVDGFLVTKAINWRYISGFRGDAGALLVTERFAYLFTDSRYIEAARDEAPGFSAVMTSVETDEIKNVVEREGVRRLAFDKEHVTVAELDKFRERFSEVEMIPVSGWVEEQRMVKTSDEVALIEKAQDIADDAFALLTDSIRIGASEIDLALEFEFTMRKMGSAGVAFPLIVVTGERSSLPHGVPSQKKIEDGDFITFDFGAAYQGYVSDETRTFIVGHASKKHEEIYNVVLEAQMAALEAVKPGASGIEVDAVARKIIEDAGYGPNFGHGLGHGVGLVVHEGPRLSKKSTDILVPGNIVTVEPGIYVPGFGGCRIEDLVLVTETGCRILSHSPKELRVL